METQAGAGNTVKTNGSGGPTPVGHPVRTPLRARLWLPRGTALPDAVWRRRHRPIMILLWSHVVGVPLFALYRGFSIGHALLESGILAIFALGATTTALSRRIRTLTASLGLLSCSAILVHFSGGVIEMHFHFFVMVGVVALYQDWLPFLTAIGYVLLHHGVVGVLEPQLVYNHEAAVQGPWRWAAIHAGFIGAASLAALARWRFSEEASEERDAAEEALRAESRVAASLHEVGRVLAADLDGDRVVQAVTDVATELTGAEFGAFFYNAVDEAGEAYVLYTLSGAPVEAFSKFGLPRNTPIFEPTFTGRGVVRIEDVTADERYGTMEPHRGMPKGHLPVRSYLAVPVYASDNSVLGGLFFGHPEPGRFDATAERLAVGIASQASVAINNARLYDSERAARRAAEIAAHRLELLSDASRALFASLEPEAVFRSVSQMVTSELADFCVIDYVEEDGSLRRIATGELAPEAAVLPVVVQPRPDDADHPINRAIRGRETIFVAAGPEGRPPAAIVVPMSGRHEVLGTLTLGIIEPSPRGVTREDIPVAEEIARRAALAVENARLFARQRTVAETLQHSLLPETLPQIPGVESAALYSAGGPGVEVGGDWYDLIRLPGGRLGIAIGDVVGRGEKAASLMGQLRNALRAYALDGKSPADLLTGLNTLISETGPEQMATMIYAVLDPVEAQLCIASAGHPPVVRLSPEREASFISVSGGLPLGASPGVRYHEETVDLDGGDTLILYTDGLVEERTSPIDVGLERLLQAAAQAPEDLSVFCRTLADQVLGDRICDDDMAVLAIRLEPVGERLEMTLPGNPQVLGPLRSVIRRWLKANGATDQEIFELLVAAGEAATNAIRHAAGPTGGEFHLKAELDGEVTITIADTGQWRDTSTGVGGRGLAIIEAYVDSVQVDKGPEGTAVTMRRRLGADDLVSAP